MRGTELSLFFSFFFISHCSGGEMLSWITLGGIGWQSDCVFFFFFSLGVNVSQVAGKTHLMVKFGRIK